MMHNYVNLHVEYKCTVWGNKAYTFSFFFYIVNAFTPAKKAYKLTHKCTM